NPIRLRSPAAKERKISQTNAGTGTLVGGGVSERPKENASKAFVGASPPRVQIPPPPPVPTSLHNGRTPVPPSGRTGVLRWGSRCDPARLTARGPPGAGVEDRRVDHRPRRRERQDWPPSGRAAVRIAITTCRAGRGRPT